MRSQSRAGNRRSHAVVDEDFFERKSRELVAPDDEIEAWELDRQDLGDIRIKDDYFNAPGSE